MRRLAGILDTLAVVREGIGDVDFRISIEFVGAEELSASAGCLDADHGFLPLLFRSRGLRPANVSKSCPDAQDHGFSTCSLTPAILGGESLLDSPFHILVLAPIIPLMRQIS